MEEYASAVRFLCVLCTIVFPIADLLMVIGYVGENGLRDIPKMIPFAVYMLFMQLCVLMLLARWYHTLLQ